MKKEFKIVICGGGSTYTAGIVKNLLEEEELKIKELWLYDIDQERQEKVSLIVKEVVKDLRPSLELKIVRMKKRHLQMQTLLWHRCESVD